MVNFRKFLPGKRIQSAGARVAYQPAASIVSAGTYERMAGQSPLLKEVLGGEAESRQIRRRVEVEEEPPLPLSQRLNIGAKLETAKQRVLQQAEKLFLLIDPEISKALTGDVAKLREQVCRVAFVGQMNAGKSSLINVLVEQAELLPADINPWTTVITNLHFGVPGAPCSGASFKFFCADEWRRLSIGGRVRELTERLIPDFDWSALNDQVEEMRRRAERKLGPSFTDLLGSEHSYPHLTPGLLNRYVGAGSLGDADSQGAVEGEYSDITKVANIHFDLGAFNFPAILVDTPGVNDPFLVRDEITRQNLEHADICVIVVTAKQPLSSADLTLLRMLRGLNKARFIIFVNKVDEIERDGYALDQVRKRIYATLEQEFSSKSISVVFGSALWARGALALSDEATGDGAGSAGAAPLSDSGDVFAELAADAMFAKSGLADLAVSISGLMGSGPIADIIRQTAGLLETVSANAAACLSLEVEVLSKMPADAAGAAQDLASLKELSRSLLSLFDAAAPRWSQVCAEQGGALRAKLREVIEGFASPSADKLAEMGDVARIAQAEARLRLRLENAYAEAFESAAEAILSEERQLVREAGRLLEARGLKDRLRIPAAHIALAGGAPSLAALSEPVSLELMNSLSGALTERQPLETLKDLIAKAISVDFEPIVETLAAQTEDSLRALSSALLQHLQILTARQLEIATGNIENALSDGLADVGSEAEFEQVLTRKRELRQRYTALTREIRAGGALEEV